MSKYEIVREQMLEADKYMRGLRDMRMDGYEVFEEYSLELAEIYGEFVEIRKRAVLDNGLAEGVVAEKAGIGKVRYLYGDIPKITRIGMDVKEDKGVVSFSGVEFRLGDKSKFDMEKYIKIVHVMKEIAFKYNMGEYRGVSYRVTGNRLKEESKIYGHALSRMTVMLNDLIELGYVFNDEVRLSFAKDGYVMVIAKGSRSLEGTERVFVVDSVVDEVLELRGLRPYYNKEKGRMRVLDEYGSLRNLSTFILRLSGETFGDYKKVTHHLDENPLFDVLSNLVVTERSTHSKYHMDSRYIGDCADPVEIYVSGDYWVRGM